MTAGGSAANGQQLTPDTAAATCAELEHVREQAIELLARLSRPPRSLRIAAGEVTVEITWEPAESGVADHAETGKASRGLARPADDDHSWPAGDEHSCPADGAAPEYLRSPGVGVFYHASEPGAEPFVCVGAVVRQGQQIGIIEAMKLMIPVEADLAGQITGILKANGEPVEYGEPLFGLAVEGA